MKKLSLWASCLLLLSAPVKAQSTYPCGFDHVHQKAIRANVNYENATKAVDNRWISSVLAGSSTAALTYTPMGYVYEVPMVMHILHTGGAVGTPYNPDSSKVAAMLDYMNKAYAAKSPFPDTTAGGCRIPLKFVLAKRTPSGAATNGILRLDASSIPNYVAKGANASNTDGVDDVDIMAFSRWNPADYYNVYIVNKIDSKDLYSSGGVAGFAYFPGSPSLDGMIVCASQVKSGSTTIAHEFGHAYSLYHTFQGDNPAVPSCPPTSPCATTGDLVCDTEPHYRSAVWASWCPPTDVNPCTGGSYKNVQNNIMDYTTCPPNRFTAGQRARVLNVIDNERSGYKTSLGAVAPTGTVKAACIPTSTTATAYVGPVVVKFNGLEVWTSDLNREKAAYVDHSYAQQCFVESSKSYAIDVLTTFNKQNVKVFIDYNNDGDFADAGEDAFAHSGTTFSSETHSGTITIPSTATKCTYLRMRVVAGLSSATISDWACGPYSNNAQAEDYAIYIKDRTSADSVSIAQTAGTNPSCVGSSVTFTATPKGGTPTYQWYINGVRNGVTTSTFTSSTLNDNDIITCKIFYTGSCGSDSTESNYIQIKVTSTAPAGVSNMLTKGTNPGCPGLDLVFKATVSGGGTAPTYSWFKNGTALSVFTDTFATSTLVAGDKIYCRVTPGGTGTCSLTPVNSDTITISFATIVPSNTISMVKGSIPSCDSTLIGFKSVATNGGSAPSYQWFVNSVAVAGATADSFENAMLKNGDIVECRIISNHPCVSPGVGDTGWSNKITIIRTLRFASSLSVAITQGSNPGCLDSLLEFTATATDGGGSPIVSWYKNGTLDAYGPVYSSTSFLDNDSIVCKMTATPASCNTRDTIFYGPIVLDLSATPTPPVISLIGTLLVSSIPSGVQWYGPDGLIPGAVGPNFHPTKEGYYYAVIKNGGCAGGISNKIYVALLSITPKNMAQLRIFPNPSNEKVTLDWGANRANGNVVLYSVTGQKLQDLKLENTSLLSIPTAQLGNGQYFIVIHDEDGNTATVPITVAH